MNKNLPFEPDDKDSLNLNSVENFIKQASLPNEILKQSIRNDKNIYNVLIVDDHVSFQKLLELTLSMNPQIGVIDCVGSGEQAVIQAQLSHYDIIFMDAMMPGIDGYEACSNLRAMPEYKLTPIIMITGLTGHEDEAKAIIAGSTAFLTKPVNQVRLKDLLTRIFFMIEHRKSQHTYTT